VPQLASPPRRIKRALGWLELLADGGPAAGLDARHRQNERGSLRHEDREVDDAILLGADELFSVDDEDRTSAIVGDPQLRHATVGRHFRDVERAGSQGIRQRVVEGSRRRRSEQRINGQRINR
jgi:hypothetical protein